MFLKRQLPVYIMVTIGIMTLLGHFIKGGFVETFIKEDSISSVSYTHLTLPTNREV